MNKKELVAKVAEKTNLPKSHVLAVADGLLEVITEALGQGESVSFTGFGKFEVRTRSSRKGRNPQTGETIEISERQLPAFKAGKLLKDAVK